MRLLIILLLYYGIGLTESQRSIPKELVECYANNSMHHFRLPMNMRVLLDIIRKAEKNSYNTLDMRTMSASLMHRLKFDGIEHNERIQEQEGILPFARTGKQSVKYKLITELVPGQPEIFPFDALTAIERCTLHQAISNTIMIKSSRDTSLLCEKIGQKLIDKVFTFPDLWNCPREYGVILTAYGTIAPGVIIGAIAASLQHQNVEIKQTFNVSDRILTPPPAENCTSTMDSAMSSAIDDQVDFIMPRHEMIHDRSMSYFSALEGVKLDNVWLTTIAGDLAEMVVHQGTILGANMNLGETGFWNNTMRPSIYYLKNKSGFFDATRAEIVSGIDGLIIAKYVQNWVNDFNSLRLSQILDMYYSEEGVTLLDENVRVCDRRKAFSYAVSETILNEQTYAASNILIYRNGITLKSSEFLKNLVDHAVTKFSVYANDHLLTELFCRDGKFHPQVEVLIAFDGASTKEYTMDFITALIDDLDVSMYGSRMGIVHGTSGQWLLNVTDSPGLAYYAVSNFTKISWPTHLNFITTFNAMWNYLNKTWEARWQRHTIGSLGQVVIIFAPLTQLTMMEQQILLKLLQDIKHHHPDLYFLYYVSEQNSHIFQPFILSEQDRLIVNPYYDAIIEFLSTVPRILKPISKQLANESSVFKNEIEDYINPPKFITYILHPQHIINIKQIAISIHNFGYGTIKVCSWRQFKLSNNQKVQCKQLNEHEDIKLLDDFTCTDTSCPYIYLRVQNATSFKKCAEIECRSPDQVRYIIRMQNTYNESSANKEISVNIFVIFYLYLQLTIFNM